MKRIVVTARGADGQPVPTSRPTAHRCDKCGEPMVLREVAEGIGTTTATYAAAQRAGLREDVQVTAEDLLRDALRQLADGVLLRTISDILP